MLQEERLEAPDEGVDLLITEEGEILNEVGDKRVVQVLWFFLDGLCALQAGGLALQTGSFAAAIGA